MFDLVGACFALGDAIGCANRANQSWLVSLSNYHPQKRHLPREAGQAQAFG